jgi:hypothetical protein
MKYTARIKQVLKSGIHKIGAVVAGEVKTVSEMPLPNYIVIELDGGPEEPCMMYRYTDAGEFCGDTWHETLKHAFSQAEFEYGLRESDFKATQ